MDGLERAKELLRVGACTCSLVKGERELTSRERGVLPLLRLIDSGEDFLGAFAADKVVGRAAAFLYILIGVSELYASVISEPALNILRDGGVRVSFSKLVPAIRNRAGTGFCPMETATREVTSAREAERVIRKTLRELNS